MKALLLLALLISNYSYSLVLSKEHQWKPGQTLKVKFLDGNRHLRKHVIKAFKTWLKDANLDVEFYDEDANKDVIYDIRVSFNGVVNSSQIGNKALTIEQKFPTLVLPSAKNLAFVNVSKKNKKHFKGIILHEVGHALALEHEHAHPDFPLVWKGEYIQKSCINPILNNLKEKGKLTEELEELVIGSCHDDHRPLSDEEVIAFDGYDEKSIMIYDAPRGAFENSKMSFQNPEKLSKRDRDLIRRFYP